MIIKEQLKILANKIRQNKADYDFYRQSVKISALSSGELNKYEYLTGEDLRYRSDPVQKAKFEYSSLVEIFNKGLDKNEKQGLLKRLKNIEDKIDDRLNEIKDNQLGIKSAAYIIGKELSREAKNILKKLNNQEKLINYQKLCLKGGNNAEYSFSDYKSLK